MGELDVLDELLEAADKVEAALAKHAAGLRLPPPNSRGNLTVPSGTVLLLARRLRELENEVARLKAKEGL
jgi:hypothetical protein